MIIYRCDKCGKELNTTADMPMDGQDMNRMYMRAESIRCSGTESIMAYDLCDVCLAGLKKACWEFMGVDDYPEIVTDVPVSVGPGPGSTETMTVEVGDEQEMVQ